MKMINPPEGSVNIPAFIAKLWHMVSDKESDSLISWGEEGTTFVIKDHNKFSMEILPIYYKHNNMASFIRQLNMYSFHKVLSIDSASLKNKSLVFSHRYFIKGQPNLLNKIQRKMHSNKEMGEMKYDQSTFNKLLVEVKHLRAVQELFGNKLATMKKENAALWREHSILRQRHAKQEKIINKVIQFLVSMVQQSSSSINVPRRVVPLMIKDRPLIVAPKKKYMFETSNGPVICEIDPNDIVPEDVLINDAQGNAVLIDNAQDAVINLPSSSTNTVIQPVPVKVVPYTFPKGKPVITTKLINSPTVASMTSDDQSTKPTYTNVRKDCRKRKGSRRYTSGKKKKISDEVPLSLNDLVPDTINTVYPDPSSTVYTNIDLKPVITSPLSNDYTDINVNTASTSTDLDEKPLISDLINDSDVLDFDFNNTSNDKKDAVKEESSSMSIIPSFGNNMSKSEADRHLNKMQSELDVLKDILKSDGLTLDVSTILELFNDDPVTLTMPPANNQLSIDPSTELMSYSPSLLDMEDLSASVDEDDPFSYSEAVLDSALNTPVVSSNKSPTFPT